MSTCQDCNHPVGWNQADGECPRNMQNYQSDQCKSRQVEWLKSKLSTAEAKLVEAERALATETKAREMSWAHHDEHHERDHARWLKMCQALGKLAPDGSPGIAWPAIFELVTGLQSENAAWRALAGVRALQHRGDGGYWFEAFGKPATIESHPTQQAAAIASATKLGLLDKDGG